jgi:hypothetical protein
LISKVENENLTLIVDEMDVYQQCEFADAKNTLKEMVFEEIEKRECYDCLLKYKLLDSFVKYLVRKDSIQGLLKASIDSERFTSAVKLLKVYNKMHCLVQGEITDLAVAEVMIN